MAGSKFERMVRSLPSLYKTEAGSLLGNLLQSLAISDEDVTVQIQNTRDQMFTSTADGRFLDARGSSVGVDRTAELGLTDDDFRELIPVLSFAPKQVRSTLISLLDVFWGPTFTRANVTSNNQETFNFGPESFVGGTATFRSGERLVKGTGTSFLTQLQPGDYIRPSGRPGTQHQKVSAVLSDTELELSLPWESPIAVNANIIKGVIRELEYEIDNGRVQNTIRFIPNAFEDLDNITIQELVNFINTNTEHNSFITASEFQDPVLGNRLNLRTNTPGLQGSFQILGGDANTSARLDFPTEIQREIRAAVFETNPNEVVVKIPSSVPVLRRRLQGSAHPRETKTIITSQEEVFNFSSLGMTSTLEIEVDGVITVINFDHLNDFNKPEQATSVEVVEVINRQILSIKAFTNSLGSAQEVALQTTFGATQYQIVGGNANNVLGFSTDLQQDPDLIIEGLPGPFLFDPINQLFTVTGIKSELAEPIQIGTVTNSIVLDDASSFPNQPGKFILNFGRANQEGPIAYNSRPNNSSLLIDASNIFQNEHLAGSSINFIVDGPTIPLVTGDSFQFFVTGTEQARDAAQDLIKSLLAAGIVIRFIIDFPEFLFECRVEGTGAPEDPDFRGELTGSGPLIF